MGSTPLILGLETATLAGSICLSKGSEVVGAISGNASISHSNSLLMDLDRLLVETSTQLEDIELFAAAVGPGSFTGLRIGLATMKALANTLNRQCVGVSTLKAIAHAAGKSKADGVVALLPAGRGEFFVQAFSVNAGRVDELDVAAHLSPLAVFSRYHEFSSLVWAGDGAHAFKEQISSQAEAHGIRFTDGSEGSRKSQWTIAPAEANLAVYVAALALQSYLDGLTESPEMLSAVYVRPSDAELKTNVVNN